MLKRTALVAVTLGLWTAQPALAAAPQFGTVVEGHSVPGSVALGMTRGEVEAVHGPPESCADQTVYDSDLCGLDARRPRRRISPAPSVPHHAGGGALEGVAVQRAIDTLAHQGPMILSRTASNATPGIEIMNP